MLESGQSKLVLHHRANSLSINHPVGSLRLLKPKAVNTVVFVWWVLFLKKFFSFKFLPTPPSSFEYRRVAEGASPAWLHPAV